MASDQLLREHSSVHPFFFSFGEGDKAPQRRVIRKTTTRKNKPQRGILSLGAHIINTPSRCCSRLRGVICSAALPSPRARCLSSPVLWQRAIIRLAALLSSGDSPPAPASMCWILHVPAAYWRARLLPARLIGFPSNLYAALQT